MGKPINEEVIRQHWGDIMRLAASIRDKSLKPSEDCATGGLEIL
jgi:hypothetical protein